jgi:hypothetical protein
MVLKQEQQQNRRKRIAKEAVRTSQYGKREEDPEDHASVDIKIYMRGPLCEL